MSDGAISQDEIDALLSGVAVDTISSPAPAGGGAGGNVSGSIDIPALQKFANDLSEPFADNLSKMTDGQFSAGAPTVELMERDGLIGVLPDTVVAVTADFASGLSGDHLYVISQEFAQKIVSLINKEENAELDDMAMSIVSEAVSTHTNDEITALEKTGRISGVSCNPGESTNSPKAMIKIPQGNFALFSYPVSLDGQGYTLWEAVGNPAAESIGQVLTGQGAGGSSMGISAADMASLGAPIDSNLQPMGMMGGGMQGSIGGGMQMSGMMGGMPMNMPNVQSLQYPSLQGAGGAQEQGNISLIMDVFMEMTVELGRTKKQIKDILGMGEGTIIELDKLAGEPVDILVNHKPIAKGEVVVIDENFGVRVTEILSPLERVSELH